MKILEIDSDELVAHITHGAVGILPTDTVYGIVASLTDNKALEKTGPIASSSANLQGGNTVITISEAIEVFGGKVDYYVDGGNMEGRRPSKIIEITHDDSVYEVRS